MLKRVLLTGAIALSCIAVSAGMSAAQNYQAMAGGDGGFAWSEGYSMEDARARAVSLCRESGYGSCSISVAERGNWHYSGGFCNGVPYIGASPQGWARSDEIVFMKGAADGNYDCYIEFQR